MAQDWFETGTQAAPPQAPGVIYGKPKAPDPYQVSKDQLSQSNEARRLQMAEEDQAMQRAKFAADQQKTATDATKTSDAENTSAFLGTRVAAGLDKLREVGSSGNPTLASETAGLFGKLGNYATPEARQRSLAAQIDVLDAALTLGTGAAYNKEQLAGYAQSYFPQIGDGPATLKDKQDRLLVLLQAARVKAGNAAPKIDAALAAAGLSNPLQNGQDKAPPALNNTVDRSTPLIANDTVAAPGGTPDLGGGGNRFEPDPALAGLKTEYLQRLGNGQSADELIAWAQQATGQPVSEEFKQGVRDQVDYHKANPGVPLEKYNVEGISMKMVPQSLARQAINEIGASPIGNFIMNAGDAVTGFNLDSMTANPDLARAGMDEQNRRNPTASTLGQIAGGATAALTGEAGLARAGIQNALVRGVGADMAYGATAGAGANDQNRLAGAGIGAGLGLAGNVGGNALSRGTGKLIAGVTDLGSQRLSKANNALTIGQALSQSGKTGAMVKGVEDRLAGFPGVGDMINARRAEGLKKFNQNSFNRALDPIGGNIGDLVGPEAIDEAAKQVSKAYDTALKGKAVVADAPFTNQMSKAVSDVMRLPRVGSEVSDSIRQIVEPYMTGPSLPGEAMQQISRELRDLKSAYKSDPLSKRIGTSIDGVEDAVFGLFRRQEPGVVPAYMKAKAAARRLYIVEDAVLAAKNSDGLFTPSQLGNAQTSSMKKYEGKRAASTAKGPFSQMQGDAQRALPSKVPDSGTAGRLATLALPGVLAGSGGGVGYAAGDSKTGAAAGLSLGVLFAAAYSRAAQRALVGAATRRNPVVQKAGQAIIKAGPTVGAVTGGATAGDVSR